MEGSANVPRTTDRLREAVEQQRQLGSSTNAPGVKPSHVDRLRQGFELLISQQTQAKLGVHTAGGLQRPESIQQAVKADVSRAAMEPNQQPLGHLPSSSSHHAMELNAPVVHEQMAAIATPFREFEPEDSHPSGDDLGSVPASPSKAAEQHEVSEEVHAQPGHSAPTYVLVENESSTESELPPNQLVLSGKMYLVDEGSSGSETDGPVGHSVSASSAAAARPLTAEDLLKMTTDDLAKAIETSEAGSPERRRLEARTDTLTRVTVGVDQIAGSWKKPIPYDAEKFGEKLQGMRDARETMKELSSSGKKDEAELRAFTEAKQRFDQLSGEARALLITASSSQRRAGFQVLKKLDPSLTTSYRSNLANILSSDLAKYRALAIVGDYRYEFTTVDGDKRIQDVSGTLSDMAAASKIYQRPAIQVLRDNPGLEAEFRRTVFDLAAASLRKDLGGLKAFVQSAIPIQKGILEGMAKKQNEAFNKKPPDSGLTRLSKLSKEQFEALEDETVVTYLKHVGLFDEGLSDHQLRPLLTIFCEGRRMSPNGVMMQGLKGPMTITPQSLDEKLAILDGLEKGIDQAIRDPKDFVAQSEYAPRLAPDEETFNNSAQGRANPIKSKGEKALDKLEAGEYGAGYTDLTAVLSNSTQVQQGLQNDLAKTMVRSGLSQLLAEGKITKDESEAMKGELRVAYTARTGAAKESGTPEILLSLLNSINNKLRLPGPDDVLG